MGRWKAAGGSTIGHNVHQWIETIVYVVQAAALRQKCINAKYV